MASLQKVKERFEQHLRSVDELISFDRIILDTCINHIDSLNEKLKTGPFKITNPTYLAEATLKSIKNVRQNDSLRVHYRSMFNSCLVLQVSYFTSALDDIFEHSAWCLVQSKERPDLHEDVLKTRNDINFQNMHSTAKTFKKYLDIEIKRDSLCNTVILAQCSRHAIVHSLGLADLKFITQTNAARPRDIKQRIDLEERIEFTSSELGYTKMAMQVFVDNLCDAIKARHQTVL